MKVIFLPLLLVIFSAAFSSADDKIKIGVLTDLSGVAAYYGNQTRVGALLAEEDLKKQGKEVQVILEDSALSTRQGLSAAQKLFFVDKVDAIYVDFTVISVAVSSLAKANEKLMVYSAAAESVAKSNPFAFKTYSNYSQGCEALAREFKKQGIKRIGILKAESEYGELCSAGVKKIYQTVMEQGYKQGELVSSQMLLFRNKNAQAIINGSFESDVMNMLHAAQKLNYRVRVGAAEDSFTTKIRDQFREQLDGSMSFGLQRLSDEMIERVKTIEGGNVLAAYEGAGLGYIHIKQIYSVLEECRQSGVECRVRKLSSAGKEATIGFEGWADRIAQLRTTIKKFRNGNFYPLGTYLSGEN